LLTIPVLSTALDKADDPSAAVKAYRQIKYERAKRHLFIQQKIAERRSGARGKNARKDLIKAEEEVEAAKKLFVLPLLQ
jgi:ATP-binding cassette, subfamily F, member 3